MEIIPFEANHIPDAAAMFAAGFKQQRQALPILPEKMENPANLTGMLEWLMGQQTGVAAVEDGKLVGYLGWMLADKFRETQRKGAYCPEWGHAAVGRNRAAVYRAMYRAASSLWVEAGVQVHAITLLAYDTDAVNTWFWNGFGLTVVDAVRALSEPLRPEPVLPAGYSVRKAGLNDTELLAVIEAEHGRHYAKPPTLMVPHQPDTAEIFDQFIRTQPNSVWMGFSGGELAGYIRFEENLNGGAQVVQGAGVIGITGAYVRPKFRGAGLASVLLNSAVRDYHAQGFTCCSVDFESFNPEAAAFWTRYFTPAALSVIRVPKR